MRIGFFTDTFLPQQNGVVTSVLSFGSELVRRGHEVFVFCPRTRLKEQNGMVITSYPSFPLGLYPEYKITIPKGSGRVPKLDIVHTHGPFSSGLFGMRVANQQGIPRVSTFHTLLSEYVQYLSGFGSNILKRLVWKYCRLYYNGFKRVVRYDGCHGIIAPSYALKGVLIQHGIEKPIVVIPNGINLDFFKPTEIDKAREKLGIGGGKVFLTLGRLGFEKNIDIILHAFRDVDAKLIVAGKGPAERELRNLVSRLNLRRKVFFKGYVAEKLKPLYYSAADAFIIASTSETQALVVAEAMACGTPVVGARSLAIPEIVHHGKNGYLFEPGAIGQLSEILRSYEPSDEMRANALRTGQRFSIEKCTEELEKFYESFS